MPRLLPEWAPQTAVLLTWPRHAGDFRDNLAAAELCYSQIAKAISVRQRLVIICEDQPERLQQTLAGAGAMLSNISMVTQASNDVWIRDYGPLSVSDGTENQPVLFHFNGWGGKYASQLDDAVAASLLDQNVFGKQNWQQAETVLEGGALETDGAGTLLATESSLFNSNRNTPAGQTTLRQDLQDRLGLDRLLILQHGHLAGDDTDGHIDTLARFADESTMLFQGCDDPDDAHFDELAAMHRELQALRRRDGGLYRLIQLPWPAPKHDADGQRMPATYANYLVINDAVLVPTYNDPADRMAMRILQGCFPQRRVVGIDCRALIEQRGSLHCATMQIHF